MEAALDGGGAAIPERLRATLEFLTKLTLTPDEVDESDVEAAVGAGVSTRELRDAVEVCAAFNVIDRIADALDFGLQSPGALAAGAKQLATRGYA